MGIGGGGGAKDRDIGKTKTYHGRRGDTEKSQDRNIGDRKTQKLTVRAQRARRRVLEFE
jgi:hypothetical protein